jgi:hypothetical protein
VYSPNGQSNWLDELADIYVALRCECGERPAANSLEGIDIIDPTLIRRYLAAAVVPRLVDGGNFDTVRADLGEVLAYELLEREFGTVIGYKLARDRETIQLPGRGIDAIGIEEPNDATSTSSEGNGTDTRLAVVLTEVKVSDDRTRPPGVVDRARKGMRNQHRGHLREERDTLNKLWNTARMIRDAATQNKMFEVCLHLENGRNDAVSIVACSVLVRPHTLVHDADCGTFESSPADYAPAYVRFLTVSLPEQLQPTLQEWDAAIGRAIERFSQGPGAGEAAA